MDRRRRLVSSIDPEYHFNRLFDHLLGIHFFAKDRAGTILFANPGLARLYGFESEESFIGRTDFDVLPIRLAEKFRIDDERVMQTGLPMLNIVELFLTPQGIPDWYLTNKLPLRSSNGDVLGIMGTIQEYRQSASIASEVLDIDRVTAYLRANSVHDTPVSELAEMFGLSTRQLEAKFKSLYNTSPSQFRIRLRLMRACELLRVTDASVSMVAVQTGFYDQSALSRHFKTVMGCTPLQFRKRFS